MKIRKLIGATGDEGLDSVHLLHGGPAAPH